MASVQEPKNASKSALWTFATSVYADPAVSRAALIAQDQAGMDVNLLLFAAWLATSGAQLDEALLERAERLSGPWRTNVVQPLRRLRRSWKQSPPHESAYAAIKDLELAAERKQLAFLEESVCLDDERPDAKTCRALLTANLRTLRRYYSAEQPLLREFERAVAAALGTADENADR
ncbi:MAG: TIGR02444 family protein [Pseudomonadota bacterium]